MWAQWNSYMHVHTPFLPSTYLFELLWLFASTITIFPLGSQSDRQYWWSVAGTSQLHWQVTVNRINYRYAQRMTLNILPNTGAFTHLQKINSLKTKLNLFHGSANANELSNSTITLWQVNAVTSCKIEIHQSQRSRFLNHCSQANLMITYGCDIFSCHWFKWNSHLYLDREVKLWVYLIIIADA